MNSMLELTDGLGLDYYFVCLSADKETLIIHSLNNYCKPIDKTVELAHITELTIQSKDELNYVCFDYENEHYHFIDYGNHVLSFLKAILQPFYISHSV
ncbi:hypothetical protein [Candidatus Enterococcus mansonii]|uniref:Uncharacterized protein n=1 Tax=Candidatus Enterococcus mansonii TaxID=1834181 RepID=A0A242CEQ8_9ENTE|nr:hypothetical protein [Enterococcus sp. 4G2_DIV0659]OTO08744.1 hypothetical protein A5880_001744 [Enterococcus sp. 4G2_DIV0659]